MGCKRKCCKKKDSGPGGEKERENAFQNNSSWCDLLCIYLLLNTGRVKIEVFISRKDFSSIGRLFFGLLSVANTRLSAQAAMLMITGRPTPAWTFSQTHIPLVCVSNMISVQVLWQSFVVWGWRERFENKIPPRGSCAAEPLEMIWQCTSPQNNEIENELWQVRCNTAGPAVPGTSLPIGMPRSFSCKGVCRENSFHCRMETMTSFQTETALEAESKRTHSHGAGIGSPYLYWVWSCERAQSSSGVCWSPGFSLQVGDLSPLGNAILASVPECCPKDMFGFLCARLLVLE